MASIFTQSDDLRDAEFERVDLSGARFIESDLSRVVMRAVELHGADLDAPWLFDGDGTFLVNGVNVIPLVETELNHRFPGRADRRAQDPAGLRSAWVSLEHSWAAALERAATVPVEALEVSVGGEWSFTQTLRHLILATDAWLGRAVLEIDQPFHPLGIADASAADDGLDMSIFTAEQHSYAHVLEVRAERVAMVRDFLATVTSEELDATRKHPWDPAYEESVRSCLHVILQEEWEHLRYALRDLDAIGR